MRQEIRALWQRLLSNWRLWGLVILLAAAALAPPPETVYLAVAAGVLALLLIWFDHETVHLVLSLLSSVFPPLKWALSHERRQQDLRRTADELNHMLAYFNYHPTLAEGELAELSSRLPYDLQCDLVKTCCQRFAEKLPKHPSPDVLELLYGCFQDKPNAEPWNRIAASDEQKRLLAEILAASHRLPWIDEIEPDAMTERILWILNRFRGAFHLQQLEDELCSWERLRTHLSAYADALPRSIKAVLSLQDLTAQIDRAIPQGLLSSSYDSAAAEVLLAMSRTWIGLWAERAKVPDTTTDNLALIALGHFSAGHEPPRGLLARLGREVITNREAFDLLLADLWKRSQPATGSPDLTELADQGPDWRRDAETDMGSGITEMVSKVLAAELKKGAWPTQLPIEQSIAEISEQAQAHHNELLRLLNELPHGADLAEWKRAVSRHNKWAGGGTLRGKTIADIKAAVESAVQEKLRKLAPPAASPRTAEELEKDLESFSQRYRPPTLAVATLPGLRARAAALGHELKVISDLLLAEAGGNRGYLITFDQSRGELADLIDLLMDKYGFERYTRYSRIGKLREGQTFESFYQSFMTDLEETLLAAFKKEGSRNWEQIEVTVQPISLVHRHDFATDAQPDLEPELPSGTYAKVFHMPSLVH